VRRALLAGLLTAALAGCSDVRVWDVPSANQNTRVQVLVLHFTSENHADSLRLLTEPSDAPVSAHYLIPDPRDPTWGRHDVVALRLVPEERRAWHAGRSHWAGRSALNDSSIGIEIVNESRCETPAGMNEVERPEDRVCSFEPYDEAQIDLLVRLLQGILERHPDIDPEDVVGHSDIAPGRRVDPGPQFPWQRLHEAGIGPWYEAETLERHRARLGEAAPAIADVQQALAAWGYGIDVTGELDVDTRFALEAFQMRFRPARFDGEADPETLAILLALLERYRPKAYAALQSEAAVAAL
jgi:N-acetylmuramoyl-L-alanine amidase